MVIFLRSLEFWKTDFPAKTTPITCCAAASSERPLGKSFLSFSLSFAPSHIMTIYASMTEPTVPLEYFALWMGTVADQRCRAPFLRAATQCSCSSVLTALLLALDLYFDGHFPIPLVCQHIFLSVMLFFLCLSASRTPFSGCLRVLGA